MELRPYFEDPPFAAVDEAAPSAEPAGFARLRRLLEAAVRLEGDLDRKRAARALRRALYSGACERAALDFTVAATTRLQALARFQTLADQADLRSRDKAELILELDRLGMRILWSERLVSTVLEMQAPVESKAAALLGLIAQGVLPSGLCAKSALEPAKALLMTREARAVLIESPALRDQMLDLLERAQARPAG